MNFIVKIRIHNTPYLRMVAQYHTAEQSRAVILMVRQDQRAEQSSDINDSAVSQSRSEQ